MLTSTPKILALDDDESWLTQVPLILGDLCEVRCYPTINQGLRAMEAEYFDIVLLDINFKGDSRSGLDVFKKIHAMDRGADVIVISGETQPDRLIQIMNAGVTHFLTKPVPPDEVRAAVKLTLQRRELRLKALNIMQDDSELIHIGRSPAMIHLKTELASVMASGVKDILLLGETGTGKEVIARMIANKCDPSKRLVPIHCGAISDGLAESELFGHVRGAFTGADKDKMSAFEVAGGGFVFLDEVGDMPLNQQAKLLRVIQERKVQRVGSTDERTVSFRSISATNMSLEKAIVEKRFREDLFYRLAKAQIKIPPLRDRLDDIPDLVHHFIAQVDRKRQIIITNDAINLLQSYSWPGNIRQLKAVIESICPRISDRIIREKDICQALPQVSEIYTSQTTRVLVGRYGAALISQERERFQRALIESDGNRDKAAQILTLSRATFFRRAKELGLVKTRSIVSKSQTATLS